MTTNDLIPASIKLKKVKDIHDVRPWANLENEQNMVAVLYDGVLLGHVYRKLRRIDRVEGNVKVGTIQEKRYAVIRPEFGNSSETFFRTRAQAVLFLVGQAGPKL